MNFPSPDPRRSREKPTLRQKKRAFSLIEVVIALGVLSFAIIPMTTLITGSLQSYRRAINDTVGRQIMTQLAANAQQARLSDLKALPSATTYFDFEGNPVSVGDPLRIYTATVTNLPDTELLNSPHLYRVGIVVTALNSGDSMRTSLQICPQD